MISTSNCRARLRVRPSQSLDESRPTMVIVALALLLLSGCGKADPPGLGEIETVDPAGFAGRYLYYVGLGGGHVPPTPAEVTIARHTSGFYSITSTAEVFESRFIWRLVGPGLLMDSYGVHGRITRADLPGQRTSPPPYGFLLDDFDTIVSKNYAVNPRFSHVAEIASRHPKESVLIQTTTYSYGIYVRQP